MSRGLLAGLPGDYFRCRTRHGADNSRSLSAGEGATRTTTCTAIGLCVSVKSKSRRVSEPADERLAIWGQVIHKERT